MSSGAEISNILNSIDVKIVIYLYFHKRATISQMLSQGVGSTDGLNRALRDLAISRLIRVDKTTIEGDDKRAKPFILTDRGQIVAQGLIDIDYQLAGN